MVSSHFVSCAASLIVKGLTRIVTEIDAAPSEGMVVAKLRSWAASNHETISKQEDEC